MITASCFKDKCVAVIGLGKSGLSATQALSAGGATVLAWDDTEKTRQALATKHYKNVTLADPAHYSWKEVDALVLAPGIPLTHPAPHPAATLARAAGVPIICDIEVLYRQQPEARYIGITGTNGKSTTTSLIGHILKCAGIACDIGGNLGTSATDFSPRGKGEAYVLETSSYQLDLIDQTHFNISVFLNITPDHLERHGGMEGYIKAKNHIFDRQGQGDSAIIAVDDEHTRAMFAKLKKEGRIGHILPVSATTVLEEGVWMEGEEVLVIGGMEGEGRYPLGRLKHLSGAHNHQNIVAATAAALQMGISIHIILEAIHSFIGLPHRMQYLGEAGHLTFINDSKATNADAAEKALKTFDHIYWILGGVPKEGGIASLAPYFPKIRKAYLIGEASDNFAKVLKKHDVPYTLSVTLAKAFAQAAGDAEKEKHAAVVLLSPACASFDQWPNFEVRGQAFCAMAEEYRNGK